jgi:hypothetical protein
MDRFANSLCLALLLTAVGAFEVPISAAEDVPVPPADAGDWMDSSHDYVADGANRLVQWMDDFYGTDTADIETASSRIRLRFGYSYDELKEGDSKVRVRGKIQLPKLSKRLALVAEGADGDSFDRGGSTADENDDQVGLQYKFGESGRNRLDGVFSVNGSADVRLGVRFRHDGQYSDFLTGRFVQTLAHQTGDKGWFTRTHADAFRRIDDNDLLAWINRVEYGDDTYGVEYRSSLQWRHRLGQGAVISYLVGLDGVTDPDPLTENYGFAINYRTAIFRKYLFLEVEPAYMWRKEEGFENREGVYAINMRFEIHFEKKPKKPISSKQESAPPAPTE